jgi:hypothetical protein
MQHQEGWPVIGAHIKRGTALGALLLLAVILSLVAAPSPQATAADKKKKAAPGGNPAPPADKDALSLPLPPGGVMVVTKKGLDELSEVPWGVLLRRKDYEELIRELDRLRALLKKRKAVLPSKCLLKGKVEGNLVVLQAQFDFVTAKPQALVSLACGLAHATGVTLDGRTPQLLGGGRLPGGDPEGFSVSVEKAGAHQLTLELVLPLTARDGGRTALTLDLPRTPSTRLTLELPGGVKDVRTANRPASVEPLLEHKGNTLSATLGAIDKLELTWKSARGAAGTALSAEGVVDVRLDGRWLTSEARLTLKPLGEPVKEWRLLVPRGAQVKAAPGEDRVREIKFPDIKASTPYVVTVHLKEPSAEPLTVHVRHKVASPRPRMRTAVGPFNVLGAARQSGSLLVSNSTADLHLEFHPHSDLARRDLTEAEQGRLANLVAAFRYGRVAAPGDKPRAPADEGAPWLELEAEKVRGQITTRVAHTLALIAPGVGEGGRSLRWQVTTVVTATPRWADVDRLRVQMPAGCTYTAAEDGGPTLPDRVREVTYNKATGVVEFRLGRGGSAPLKAFTLTVEGVYQPPDGKAPGPEGTPPGLRRVPGGPSTIGPSGRVALSLPHPLGTIEQGGEVTVRAARKELSAPNLESAGLELVRQSTHELAWRSSRRAPQRVVFSWRPWRPEVRAVAKVDLTLTGKTAHVTRHVLNYTFPQPPPPTVTLRVPASVARSLRVLEGGQLAGAGAGEDPRVVNLTKPSKREPKRAHRLVLAYAAPPVRIGKSGAVRIPLVRPEGITQGETKVRVWSEPDALPTPAGKVWTELNIEEVKERNRLPVLVLGSDRADLPLVLRLGSSGRESSVLAERVLVRAEVLTGGAQKYRVSYLLVRLAGHHLDVELPAPVANVQLEVRLNDKQVVPQTVDENGAPSLYGRVARLRVSPQLLRRPQRRGLRRYSGASPERNEGAVLEVRYELSPGRTGGGLLRTVLHPPVLRGLSGQEILRWQVTLPPGWVPLSPEGGPGGERTWARRGWLLAPRLVMTSADLERWFRGEHSPASGSQEEEEPSVPSLVCWRSGPDTLTVLHVAQQGWLLLCSLGLLALGLGLAWLTWGTPGHPGGGSWVWPVVALVALALVVAALLWPTALGQVAYGCEPGAAVLVVVAAVQWFLHERYRRRVIFLPSFSRTRAGSSLLHSEAARPPGEPSTVDAVPRTGSSVERETNPKG